MKIVHLEKSHPGSPEDFGTHRKEGLLGVFRSGNGWYFDFYNLDRPDPSHKHILSNDVATELLDWMIELMGEEERRDFTKSLINKHL